MKYYPRILLAIALSAAWMLADFGAPSTPEASAQQGGANNGGDQGGGRGRGRGRGRGAQGQGTEGGGEQAQQAGGNGGGIGSIFGRGQRGQRGQRGRGENGNGPGTTEQQNNNRGPGGGRGPGQFAITQPLDPKELARQTFERLDQNRDGMLQENEQRGLRGMGATADTDRNGVITLAELEASFANPGGQPDGGPGRRGGPRGEERNQSENPDASQEDRGRRGGGRRGGRGNEEQNGEENNPSRGQGGGGEGQQQRNREQQNASRQNSDKKDPQLAKTIMSTMTEKSYRFKPAKDQLPKELPSWFTAMLSKDSNRDGQVDMSEFTRTWTESQLREFNQRDSDGDGIITADDALKGK